MRHECPLPLREVFTVQCLRAATSLQYFGDTVSLFHLGMCLWNILVPDGECLCYEVLSLLHAQAVLFHFALHKFNDNTFQHQTFPGVCPSYLSDRISPIFLPISDVHLFLLTYICCRSLNFSSSVVWGGLLFLLFISLLTLEWICLLLALTVITESLFNMRCYGLPKVHSFDSWFSAYSASGGW